MTKAIILLSILLAVVVTSVVSDECSNLTNKQSCGKHPGQCANTPLVSYTGRMD